MASRRRRGSGADQIGKLLGKAITALITGLFSARAEKPARSSPRSGGRPASGGRGFDQEIVGERSYQAALLSIAGSGEVRHYCQAAVVPEDGNPHDSQAVRVTIEGKTVGYLARAVARQYRASHGNKIAGCEAVIVGGGDRYLGVWLDLEI